MVVHKAVRFNEVALFPPCGSGFPAAKIEAESLSHKNMLYYLEGWRGEP
jgi:hypothetical protein